MGVRSSAIRQKRSMGQVFLRSSWPVQKVVDKLRAWKTERVLEIGPGGGILTRGLLGAGFQVTAVEKDDRFAERLADYNRSRGDQSGGTLDVVNDDFLKFDLEGWVAESGQRSAIVGNIPYNISSPVLIKVLEQINKVQGIYLLTQLEFAARLAAQAGTRSFGSLSVFTQLRSRVTLECKVDRSCFSPVPRVDSALVSFQAAKSPLPAELLKNVEALTRRAFMGRRKMLRNAVGMFFNDKTTGTCPVDLNRRPDSLYPMEYGELARFLFPDED